MSAPVKRVVVVLLDKAKAMERCNRRKIDDPGLLNPKRPRLLGGVLFGEMKFVLSNFFSSEDLSISYES